MSYLSPCFRRDGKPKQVFKSRSAAVEAKSLTQTTYKCPLGHWHIANR